MNKILVAIMTALISTTNIAVADEDPHPLWNAGDWDHVRAANNAKTQHLSLFVHARDARRYCAADDRVVWLDRHTGIYYTAGQAAYGLLKPGYYVCERQAIIIGAQASTGGP